MNRLPFNGLRFLVAVVKVQGEKKKKHAHAQTRSSCSICWFTGCERKLTVSTTQVSFKREAKEIEGVCTQACRITIRVLQMYSYIIDNFRMGLNFIVSIGWWMGTKQLLEDNAATAFTVTSPVATRGNEPTACVGTHFSAALSLVWLDLVLSCFVLFCFVLADSLLKNLRNFGGERVR